MHRYILLLTWCLMAVNAKSQSALVAGDIAFIGINSDGSEDHFSFVLLRDFESGTEIKFTDNGWTSAGSFNSEYPESHITWTANSDLMAGSIEYVTTYNGNQLATSTLGTITGEKMTISVAGDQVLAYQGNKSDPVFIAALSFNYNNATMGEEFDGESTSNSTTALPDGLTLGSNAIHTFHQDQLIEMDNGMYNCVQTDGDKESLLAAICDVNNWQVDNDEAFDLVNCTFNVSVPTGIEFKDGKARNEKITLGSNVITIRFSSDEKCQVELYNARGVLVRNYSKIDGEFQAEISTAQLSKGLYLLYFVYNDERVVKKIIL